MLVLIDEAKNYLNNIIEANNGKIKKAQGEIDKIKKSPSISSADQKRINQLEVNINNLQMENQASVDALKILENEESKIENSHTLPSDNLRPQNIINIKLPITPIVE